MIHYIRHGESTFNFQADVKLRNQMGDQFSKSSPQYLSLKFHPKFVDCGLTENGRSQCKNAESQIRDIPISLVLVSPMRRTLQTCHQIFKNHPSKPKIVVDPGMRQIFSSSCDIGSRLDQGLLDFPYFDFSKVKNVQYWYIESIRHEEIRELLVQKVHIKIENLIKEGIKQKQLKEKVKEASFQIMLQFLKEGFGKLDHNSFSNFEDQKCQLKSLSIHHQHIAVVSHHDNIWMHTGKKTKNCQILSYPASQL